jgi:uncharacterized membrane protein
MIENTFKKHKASLSKPELFALKLTEKVGTFGFFLIILFWTVCWLGWNMFAPSSFRFDPYPAFVLWLFISNMIQIFLMPLIMIGQNLQSKHAEIRAESDYQVNIKAEKDVKELKKDINKLKVKMDQLLQQMDTLLTAPKH